MPRWVRPCFLLLASVLGRFAVVLVYRWCSRDTALTHGELFASLNVLEGEFSEVDNQHSPGPASLLGGAILGIVVVFVTAPLPVAVGSVAHRLLVLQAGSQGPGDRGQRGSQPGQG